MRKIQHFPPFGSFPKIHPKWSTQASLTQRKSRGEMKLGYISSVQCSHRVTTLDNRFDTTITFSSEFRLLMDAWYILHIVGLLIGSVVSAVLGKFILKFYSTILFTDRNIFTYLSSASVVALQLIVHSRVGQMRI